MSSRYSVSRCIFSDMITFYQFIFFFYYFVVVRLLHFLFIAAWRQLILVVAMVAGVAVSDK